jgi:hypothetical protein
MPRSSWIIQEYLSCFKYKKIIYTTRKIKSFSDFNKEKTSVDVADNNSLESLEAYNNTTSRLSNKFSFEKYKNNPEM